MIRINENTILGRYSADKVHIDFGFDPPGVMVGSRNPGLAPKLESELKRAGLKFSRIYNNFDIDCANKQDEEGTAQLVKEILTSIGVKF